MSGRKSKVLMDSIDLEILDILDRYNQEDIGVLELAEKINLTHQNLKKHLEKLIRLDLVDPITTKGSNKISLVTFRMFSECGDPKIEKRAKELEIVRSFLKKVNTLDYEKETIAKLSKELKKKKKKSKT